MIIKRDTYLQELIDRKDNGLIKVITGIRRVGKSYLLFNLFQEHLIESGVAEDHIISIILDDRRFIQYQDPDVLYQYITSRITDDNQYYILLDEVQMLKEFESVLNSLLHIRNADIYVTGSNSRFLSKDIITEFRGRGDEVHVYPLSFAEYMSASEKPISAGWKEYYTYGGLPYILTRKTEAQKIQYLSSLFKETYLKDIISRNNIKNDIGLETILDILSSSVGSLTNPKRIADTFKTTGENPQLTTTTVKKYLDCLEDAYIISSAKRYDVKGRKYIGTPLKYYFEDLGLRNVRINFRQQEETHIMENIIYNELRMRGYSVDVGVVEKSEEKENHVWSRRQYEVDFVVNLGSRRYYIQSAYQMPDGDKTNQEKRPLLSINDSFKKIIIVKDDIMLKRDEDGIVTMSIFDFLLDKNSLDK